MRKGVHDYPYHKGTNIMAWILQCLACVVLIGISAWALSVVSQSNYDLQGYRSLFNASGAILIVLASLTILVNVAEMVLIGAGRLAPALYLAFACGKMAVWTVLWVLELAALDIIGVVLFGVLVASALTQLIHGAHIVHLKRKGTLTSAATGGAYTPAHNATGGAYTPSHNPEYCVPEAAPAHNPKYGVPEAAPAPYLSHGGQPAAS
ncbi:hypothetical protein F4780DRAFT_65122 [Xylariomycetidae sp. FL0641]|nr:hypothetical protein F4780DRAFT_65122 [Xylariomycetidae sp. FL0641]